MNNLLNKFSLLICFYLLIIFQPLQSKAQAELGTPSQVIDSLELKKTIPLSEIISRSAEDKDALQKIRQGFLPPAEMKLIMINIDSLISLYESKLAITAKDLSTYKSIHELETSKRLWIHVDIKLSETEKKLTKHVEDLTDKEKKVIKIKDIWINTDESLRSSNIYPVLAEEFTNINSIADSILNEITAEIKFILDQQSKLINYSIETKNKLGKINALMAEKNIRNIQTNLPPLWDFNEISKSSVGLVKQVSRVIGDEIEPFKTFTTEFKNEIRLHISFIIGFFIFFIFLYFRTRKYINTGEPISEKVIRIFRFPVPLALIMSAYSTLYLYDAAPLLFVELVILVIVIAIIPLIHIIIPQLTRKYTYYLTGLFLATRLLGMTLEQSIQVRILVIIVSVLSAYILLLVLRKVGKADQENSSGSLVLAKAGLLLCILSLSVAIIGNVTGAGELSMMLCVGTLRFVMAVVLFFITMNILKALLTLFMYSKTIMSIHLFKANSTEIYRFSIKLIYVFTFLLLCNSLLEVFNMKDSFFNALEDFLEEVRTIGEFEYSVGSILLFIIVVYLSALAGKVLKTFIEDGILFNFNVKRGLALSIGTLTRYLLVTTGVLIAISAVGISLDKLTVLIGALGVGIGFGLQSIFNNLVSGLILLFDRPVQIDDTVEVGNLIGKVKSIGLRTSSIRTFDGAEVIVPNGELISKEVINWTRSDPQRRMELIIGVAYDSDLKVVEDVIKNTLEGHSDVIKYPNPLILMNKLNDHSIDFRILFWTDNYDQWMRIRSEVLLSIFEALKIKNIEIPFPQRDLYIKNLDSIVGNLKK